MWKQTPEHQQTYTKLKETIVTAMENNIGKVTIKKKK